MKGRTALSSWLLLAISFSVSTCFADEHVHGRYIVETECPEDLGRHAADADVFHTMRMRGISFDVVHKYNTPGVLCGASITVRSADDIRKLSDITGVVAVHPVHSIPVPPASHSVSARDLNDSNPSAPLRHVHAMTGVDKLHAQGILGQGIKIGIIETGIDYTHPALGGKIGPGNKIIGSDSYYDFTSHSTITAGVIGADPGNSLGIVGVAPNANISAYNALFSDLLDAPTDLFVSAMLRALDDKMDIILVAIWLGQVHQSDVLSIVADRIAQRGQLVILSAGDQGVQGAWYSANPIFHDNVISVGSVKSPVIPSLKAAVTGVDHPPIVYSGAAPIDVVGDVPVYVFPTIINETLPCEQMPQNMPDLSDYVVLMRLGYCFRMLLRDIWDKGGRNVLFYDPEDGGSQKFETYQGIGRVISSSDANFLEQQIKNGKSVKLNFQAHQDVSYRPDDTFGLVSSFSNYGPAPDMSLSTSLVAPGEHIVSAFPVAMGGSDVASGTGLAAAYVAGVAALVLQAKGNTQDVARSMRDLLQSTARAVLAAKEDGNLLQTVAQQGAGLIDAEAAINTKTIVTPAQILLNTTAHFVPSHYITVKNMGSEPVSYDLTHVAAATALTLQPTFPLFSRAPVELVDAPASVSIEPSTFTVAPGASQTVMLTFTAPSNLDKTRLPVFSGFVTISSSQEKLQVAYLGAVGDLKEQRVLDTTATFAPVDLPFLGKGHFTVPDFPVAPNHTFHNTSQGVKIDYRLSFFSPLVLIDLCDKDVDFQPARGDKALEVPTLGRIETARNVLRSAEVRGRNYDPPETLYGASFVGELSNSTRVPSGPYRILVRALRATGDPGVSGDYESWLSPLFYYNSTF